MGRTLTVTVHSARDLANADADEGGQSDPYVIVCFDNKVDQELGRTPTVEDTSEPQWDHTFEVDITSHIQAAVDEGKEEPTMITFCVYDGDAGESEALGVAGIAFKELAQKGKIEGDLPVFMGSGTINVSVSMKKVKKDSMLTNDTLLKIGGGVAGAVAIGAIGGFLYKKHQKKKEQLAEAGEDDSRVDMAYGYIDDGDNEDDEEDEDRGALKKWWEMDDEDEENDDEENRWVDDGY